MVERSISPVKSVFVPAWKPTHRVILYTAVSHTEEFYTGKVLIDADVVGGDNSGAKN